MKQVGVLPMFSDHALLLKQKAARERDSYVPC